MKRLFAEPLRKHTTFKIGGPVEVLSIPESEEELIKEIQGLKIGGTSYRLLGKGSNLLVSDKGLKGVVIKNTRACLDLNKNGNIVTVGSSVSLPAFVKFCVNNDLEGMEFLCSIPATVGGALYMNAGLGRHMKSVISDKLVSVKFFDGAEIKEIEKWDCAFSHRYSIFHKNPHWIILGASFFLRDQPGGIGKQKIRDRMELVKQKQDRRFPNAGSIFRNHSDLAMRMINGLRIGDAVIHNNWISNLGNASFNDVMWLIRIAKYLSLLEFTRSELEIEIWK